MGERSCYVSLKFINFYFFAIFILSLCCFSSSNTSIVTTTVSTKDNGTLETITISQPQPINTCFYAEEDLCLLLNDTNGCKECVQHPIQSDSLVCCNVTDIEKSLSCASKVEWSNIHMRNVTVDELDISSKFWKRLTSLVITDGHINKITKEFSKFSTPKCVNISNNNITNIHQRAFKELTPLQVLDLSHNKLSTIPNLNSIQGNLSIDIRGNSGILCKSVLEYIEKGNINFIDPNSTFCLSNQTYNWFNSTDSIPLRQLERMKQFQSECPVISQTQKCTCDPERMTYEERNDGPQLVFAAKVDCSNLGLTELPDTLPMMTISLNVSHNNITNLAALSNNPTYHNLLRLYADHNKISNILDLEGTKFLENFDTLFLRGNVLKSIPIYILSNTLDKSPDGKMLYLEGNYLHCDCNSAKELKLWLLARQNHIPDADRISCEDMKEKVLDLSDQKLCHSQHDWADYLYYLIFTEVILFLALVMKVSYDYWIFKTAGYLPWPANRMPKLPCDWLCES